MASAPLPAQENPRDPEPETPATLTVELDPESELPAGDWSTGVQLFEGSIDSWYGLESFPSGSPPGEPAVFRKVPPGVWTVVVLILGQEYEFQVVYSGEITLAPGEDRRLVVTPNQPLRRGRVLLRGEPVSGRITFQPNFREKEGGTEHREVAPLTMLATDDEGRFEVFLPAGLYNLVMVRGVDMVTVPAIEVAPEQAEIVVRLPGARVSGRVVDSEGQPVQSQVTALRLADDSEQLETLLPFTTIGEMDGSFEVNALTAGRWRILATSGAGLEGGVEVTLKPDEVRDGVEIVIGDTIKVSGRVVTTSGDPVPEASVRGFLVDAENAVPSFLSTGSDAQGRFEVEVPARLGAELHLNLTGPGIPISGIRTSLAYEMEIVVPEQGGRVRLQGSPSYFAPGKLMLQAEDGGLVNLSLFATAGGPVVRGPSEMVIPALAVGAWRVVAVPNPQVAVAYVPLDLSLLQTLASFVVEPGGSVEVTLE